MKRTIFAIAMSMALLLGLPADAWAQTLLFPGGQVIGIRLGSDDVTVAAFDETAGSAAREAGLQIGDRLLRVDGIPISSAQEVRSALPEEGSVTIEVRRDGRERTLTLTPIPGEDGPRLGVYLRQGIAGIGTVTFYDPETHRFGALGHGVCDSRGNLAPMTRGQAYQAEVESVKKGASGDPGQLRGSAEAEDLWGELTKNTHQGVFGIRELPMEGPPLPAAAFEEIQTGSATIRSTIADDDVQEYSVEILKIYPQDRPDGRQFLLKVTDPRLLNTTGGIVQGMSGSPICQNGKIVGAVTHVLVNDPTMGYGIYIGNMLEAAA